MWTLQEEAGEKNKEIVNNGNAYIFQKPIPTNQLHRGIVHNASEWETIFVPLYHLSSALSYLSPN